MSELALVFAVIASMTAPASAQPDDEEIKEAERLTLDANRAHQTGDFDKAVELYLEALKIVEEPELHYNLGQSYRFSKKLRQALRHYEKYLELAPDGRVAKNARNFVKLLEAEIEKLPPEKPPDTVIPPDPVVEPPVEDKPIATTPPREESWGLRITGIVVGAVGIAGLGGGGFYAMRARKLSSDLSDSEREQWTADEIRDFDRGEKAERNAIALSVAGGVLVASGIVLYLVGRPSGESEPSVQPAVSVGDGVGVLSVSGRF